MSHWLSKMDRGAEGAAPMRDVISYFLAPVKKIRLMLGGLGRFLG